MAFVPLLVSHSVVLLTILTVVVTLSVQLHCSPVIVTFWSATETARAIAVLKASSCLDKLARYVSMVMRSIKLNTTAGCERCRGRSVCLWTLSPQHCASLCLHARRAVGVKKNSSKQVPRHLQFQYLFSAQECLAPAATAIT